MAGRYGSSSTSSTSNDATGTNTAEAGVGGAAGGRGAIRDVPPLQALHLIVEETLSDPGMGGASTNRNKRLKR